MPESVDTDLDARNKALLAAMAEAGTQGANTFKETQAALQTAQQQAVARAAQRASLIGGPEAQGFESLASDQFERGRANVGAEGQRFAADLARRSAAYQQALGGIGAAVPIARADAQRRLSASRARELTYDQQNKELVTQAFGAAELQKEDAARALREFRSGKSTDPKLAELKLNEQALLKEKQARVLNKGLTDKDFLVKWFKDQDRLTGAVSQNRSQQKRGRRALEKGDRAQRAALQALIDAPLSDAARRIAIESGVDPNRAYGLLTRVEEESTVGKRPEVGTVAKEAGLSAADYKTVQTNQLYQSAVARLNEALDSGMDWNTAKQIIDELPRHLRRSRRALTAEFKTPFTKRGASSRLKDRKAIQELNELGQD